MRIGIFGKGGSGKSTLTVLLARALRRREYDVFVVDADSTNVGLARALGLARSPLPLIDHFGGAVFSGGRVTCPVDDPTDLPGASLTLESLPSGYHETTPDGIHFMILGKMGSEGAGAGCDGPIAKIARDLRVRSGTGAAVTLLDFKAGFEDTARGVVTGLDWMVLVIDPTSASLHMATDMKRIISQLRSGALPATEHLTDRALVKIANRLYRNAAVQGVSYVLNKVPDDDTEALIRERLDRYEIEPIGVLPWDDAIARDWLLEVPLGGVHSGDMPRIVTALEAAVCEVRRVAG
jgi:CO dehydrogenase maturation factor